jgi:TonB family protein
MRFGQRFCECFSWGTSAVMHVAAVGAIAHFGSAAVMWFSDSSSPPGQAVTIQARFASAAAADELPITAIVRPDLRLPKAEEKGELSPQRVEIEKTYVKTEIPPPVVEVGELVEQFVATEAVEVVIGRASSPVDQPQVEEEELATTAKTSKRQLAEPSLGERDVAADDVDVRPSIEGADEPPRPLPTNASPGYPAAAVREHREGRVVVLMAVSAEGKVTRAEIVKSSGWADVDRAALATAKTWKFIPARHNGVAVAHEFTKPWNFRIEN